jgi:hypothetical protein
MNNFIMREGQVNSPDQEHKELLPSLPRYGDTSRPMGFSWMYSRVSCINPYYST